MRNDLINHASIHLLHCHVNAWCFDPISPYVSVGRNRLGVQRQFDLFKSTGT